VLLLHISADFIDSFGNDNHEPFEHHISMLTTRLPGYQPLCSLII